MSSIPLFVIEKITLGVKEKSEQISCKAKIKNKLMRKQICKDDAHNATL